ncbi:MAG TPA: DUF1858 domain-containing protein [Verrucomicrobiae bacterium]|nr:DUF1858 domain-containing protein [Verrucomicrobiae bacterium]
MDEILGSSVVEDVLSKYPGTLEIFVAHGFKDLTNPVMRKTMAKIATIEKVCRMKGVDMNEFLGKLNAHAAAVKQG